jgi:hypothetical protein
LIGQLVAFIVAPLCTIAALPLGLHHVAQQRASRFPISHPKIGRVWAVMVFVLGWSPLFLLEPLNSPFDHPISHNELAGMGMALGLGFGPLCTLVALVLGVHRLWRGVMGDDLPPIELDLTVERPTDES